MLAIIVFFLIRLSIKIIFIYLPVEFVYLELMLRDVVEWIKYQFDSFEELNPDRGKEIRGEEILINLGIDEELRKNNVVILGIIFALGVKWAYSQDTQIQVLGICVVAASAIIYCGPKIYQYILDSLSSAEDPDQREGEDYPSDQSEKLWTTSKIEKRILTILLNILHGKIHQHMDQCAKVRCNGYGWWSISTYSAES